MPILRAAVFAVAAVCVAAPPAVAYEVSKTSRGTALRWAVGTVPVMVAVSDGPLPQDAARAAVRAAFDTYVASLTAIAPAMTFFDIADVDGAAPDADGSDGVTLVHWVMSGWDDDFEQTALAITTINYDPRSGEITDADIAVNAEAFPWAAAGDCHDAYDLQNAVTHEIGHLLGLAHDTRDEEATMFPSAATCETKKRDLDDSDVAGLAYLYAELGPAQPAKMPFACSTAGGGGAPWGFVVTLALIVGFAGRRRAAALALLLAVGAPPAARATTVEELRLEDLGRGSAVVVRGTVVSQQTTTARGRIYTDARVQVAECWRGACPAEVVVRQLGGETADAATTVLGTARLAVGGEVVLFLRARKDGAYSPVGMAQGAFDVIRDGRGRLAGLARDVRALRFVRGAARAEVERVDVDSARRAAAAE